MASIIPVVRSASGEAHGVAVAIERGPIGDEAAGSACVTFTVGAQLWVVAVSDAKPGDDTAVKICADVQRGAEAGASPSEALFAREEREALARDEFAAADACDVRVLAIDTHSGRCVQVRGGTGADLQVQSGATELAPSGHLTVDLGPAGAHGTLTIAYAVSTPTHASHTLDLGVASELAAIDVVNTRFALFAASHHIPDAVRRSFHIAFDDLLNNVVTYAYEGRVGERIDIHIVLTEGYLEAEISDDGPAFDPFALDAPDTELALEDRDIGGLGVHLIRMMMDECRHERRLARNVATLRKYL